MKYGKFTLIKTETGKEDPKFNYKVIDEAGKVISERNSSREYVACTAHGAFYFGRLDLIGKGDHANYLKKCQGFTRTIQNRKSVWSAAPVTDAIEPDPIAKLENI